MILYTSLHNHHIEDHTKSLDRNQNILSDINGHQNTVSVDRLKPAYMEVDNPEELYDHVPLQNPIPSPPSSITIKEQPSSRINTCTHSGRASTISATSQSVTFVSSLEGGSIVGATPPRNKVIT